MTWLSQMKPPMNIMWYSDESPKNGQISYDSLTGTDLCQYVSGRCKTKESNFYIWKHITHKIVCNVTPRYIPCLRLSLILWMSSIVVNMAFLWVTQCTTALLMLMTSVCRIQQLLDYNAWLIYASKWIFNFGIKNGQCVSAGYKPDCFVTESIWYLNENIMETVTKLEILGVTFTNNVTCSDHVQNRVQKCRRAFFFSQRYRYELSKFK